MSVTVDLEGFAELEQKLEKLSTAAGKGALRRALRKSAAPLAELMREGAPERKGALAQSVAVSTKLSQRQAGLHRRMFQDDRASVEMFVGAGPLPQAVAQEFGTKDHPPQPFARPAWDADQNALLERLKVDLWDEIRKSIGRAERKAARQAAGD
ncbi:HK97-gp10 family putative phage morphogenesis protein [Palleronia sp. LCG004]|uniref:HK97-gp10 family putative phage morphogenesis protein n=1 Tax=Palleronia sp. LCG004 TaxID=3079304 RepID=UPI0029422A06|nr:HK97-gp10 family putative phage morphogenesis protein [Palleronia sp. LCG004]WOI54960.1 HK97 gp10 family phage protein [Palleronia sp. LCG004]